MPQAPQTPPQPQYAPAPPPGGYAQPGAPMQGAPLPKKGLHPGVIIGIILGVIALLGIIAAVVFAVAIPALKSSSDTAVPLPVETTQSASTGLPDGVYETPYEAAEAEMPEGYVIELAEDEAERKVYWAGPPASEWDTSLVVERTDGGWRVTEASAFNAFEGEDPDGGSGGEDGSSTGATDAQALVTRFLTAIKEDRPQDAQRVTIAPFRDDPASAQYSNGEFKSFTIDPVEPQSDGTFFVFTTEKWSWGADKWRYHVVPTEAGLRIRELGPA